MTKLNDIFAIENAAKDHLIQPWDEIKSLGSEIRPIISSAENIYLIDANGKKLIDAPAGMWCSQVGYGRKEIAQTMSDQAMMLSYNSPWYTTSSPAALLSKKIADFTPGDLNHIFFTSGGSTAVDSALRFVQFYQHSRGKADKKFILARLGGYHGSTHLAAACSGDLTSKPKFNLDQEPISFLSSPNPLKLPDGVSKEGFCDFLLDELRERIKELGADSIGALIAEPVQASGGVIIPPKNYAEGMVKICRDNDILYISDEVVTAFGRCGA
jgi:adenosylmethionine-8-amino-7-oxononanoate aminotransferase